MKNELDLGLDSPTHNGEFFLNSPPQMHMDEHLFQQVLGKNFRTLLLLFIHKHAYVQLNSSSSSFKCI